MAKPKKITRRDWFRLKVPHENKMLDESGSVSPETVEASSPEQTGDSAGLQPIEHPPNYGMDLSELPPMREAVLSVEQVSALFADVAQLGTDVMLMQRAAGAKRAGASKSESLTQLEAAKSSLLTGQISRLQIRYCWQDQQWIDTLKREPDGLHLVRIAHKLN